jgi:hypothetical protein
MTTGGERLVGLFASKNLIVLLGGQIMAQIHFVRCRDIQTNSI